MDAHGEHGKATPLVQAGDLATGPYPVAKVAVTAQHKVLQGAAPIGDGPHDSLERKIMTYEDRLVPLYGPTAAQAIAHHRERVLCDAYKIKCSVCGYIFQPGDRWYEMQWSAAVVCTDDRDSTTTEQVAHLGMIPLEGEGS
jgi:hypothetical protein